MTMRKYVTIISGIYHDGFRDYPLASNDVSDVMKMTYRGFAYIDGNRMRINPSGDPYGAVYDFDILPATPESVRIEREYEDGYEYGKKQQRRFWPKGEVSDNFKDGYRKAWEDKGKPFDNAYWNRQYYRRRYGR